MTPDVYTIRDLARLLQCSVNTLHRKLPSLYDQGFPRPLPVLGLRFSVWQVQAWVRGYNADLDPTTDMPRFVSAHKKFLSERLKQD